MNHLGRYEITSELGRGGMGVVYLAKDPKINRPVAMKCLHLSQGGGNEEKKRFAKEMRALGRLVHPNIVTIFDADEDPVTGNAYIVMEYVEGKSLAQILSEGQQLTINQIREIGVQICMALDFAHEKGIVHRDMKPGNVLIAYDAQELNQTVKLVDFGIARLEEEGATQTSSFLGTPRYMSPEQCNGDTIDKRSDMFSASAVIYELLTLRKAFSGDSPQAIIYQVITGHPDPPMNISKKVPKDLSDAVMKGLEKKPADRFTSCRKMALAMRGEAPSPSLWSSFITSCRKMALAMKGQPAPQGGQRMQTESEMAGEESSPTLTLESDKTVDSSLAVGARLAGGVLPTPLRRGGYRTTVIVVLGITLLLGSALMIGPFALRGQRALRELKIPSFSETVPVLPAPVQPQAPENKGSAVFLIDPAGAKVYIDGGLSGISPLTISLPAGSHDIMIVKPGYNVLEATIHLPAGEKVPIELTLEKEKEGQ